MEDEKHGTYARVFESIERILIPIEIDRLEYLISYCLKNYYIKRANAVPNGDYIPKWKNEADKSEQYAKGWGDSNSKPEVEVIINGFKYKI